MRCLMPLLLCATSLAVELRITGSVRTTTRAPLSGARVIAESNGVRTEAFTAANGAFTLTLPGAGRALISVDHAGYYPLRDEAVDVRPGDEVAFTLEPVREQIESVVVSARPESVDMDTAAPKRTIAATEIQSIPYPNTNDFRSALRILPGVIRDNRGGLHFNGAAEDQVLYTLNGFNVNDPLTSRFETRFSVESVQSAEIASGSLPAEFGKGSAGALAVQTNTGDDKLRYSATNFVPGFENRKGWTIGDWTPRVNVSGPIVRGRAWFSNSVDTQYVKTIVRDLPKGEDRTTSVRASNMLNGQVNLAPSRILHLGFLASRWSAARTGLTALDPVETTVDRRARQWFFHAKHQTYLTSGLLVEAGYAANRTFGREIPQGEGPLLFTSEGKRGNYFSDAVRDSARDQAIVNVSLPSMTWRGSHALRAGIDLDRVAYGQSVRRSGLDYLDARGGLVRRTRFFGEGGLARSNGEGAVFWQDSWRARPGLLLELGTRADWDSVVREWSLSPRFGAAWSPPGLADTKLYLGAGQLFDATSLRLFTRPLDQYAVTTYFEPGGAVARGPALTAFEIPARGLSRPRHRTLSAGAEHHGRSGFSVRADLLHRRGVRGFTYLNSTANPGDPAPDWAVASGARMLDGVFLLSNQRIDSHRSYTFSLRQGFRRQYQWMAAYTWSRSLSNAVVDIQVDDPVAVLSNSGPMPWDAPHRFVSWGYLPLPRENWAVSYLVDARSGFPYSIVRGDGSVSGTVNERRYPYFLEANLHIERRFAFRQHRWALRFGANNLTGRINPDSVNNILGSASYGRFYGGVGRSTNVRIRWLGRVL